MICRWSNPRCSRNESAALIFWLLLYQDKSNEAFDSSFELSITRIGAGYDDTFELRGFDFETDNQIDLLYIQLPLLFQLSTDPPERTGFF